MRADADVASIRMVHASNDVDESFFWVGHVGSSASGAPMRTSLKSESDYLRYAETDERVGSSACPLSPKPLPPSPTARFPLRQPLPPRAGFGGHPSRDARERWPAIRSQRAQRAVWRRMAERVGFEPTCPCGQDAFEAPPLRPLRYLSVFTTLAVSFADSPPALALRSLHYAHSAQLAPFRSRRSPSRLKRVS